MMLRKLWFMLLFITQRSQPYEYNHFPQLPAKPERGRHYQQHPRRSLLSGRERAFLGSVGLVLVSFQKRAAP